MREARGTEGWGTVRWGALSMRMARGAAGLAEGLGAAEFAETDEQRSPCVGTESLRVGIQAGSSAVHLTSGGAGRGPAPGRLSYT